MLQMRILFLLLLFILSAQVSSQVLDSLSVKWLLEDAFENDYIQLSEATYVLPEEVNQALELYKIGEYRRTIEILEKIRQLELPDNRLDFVAFLLAEAYRQLKLRENARLEYEFVASHFPGSDKTAPSLFRIMEFAVDKNDVDKSDSVYQEFRKRYLKHPLYNSVLYTYGKLLFRLNRFDEAALYLSQIAKTSTRFLQSQFLMSLCYIQTKEIQKALLLLDYVRKNTQDNEMTAEATILIGDIYYSQKNLKVALETYKTVPESASRYHYTLVKIAKAEVELGNYPNAMEIAKQFLKKYKDSEHYFEMASILEQAYIKLGDEGNASKVDGLIQNQIVNVRLAFEIFQEIDHLVDLSKNWQILEYEAIKAGKNDIVQYSQNVKKRIRELDYKFNQLLSGIDPGSTQKYSNVVPHLAERRYLALIKKQMTSVADSINKMKGTLHSKTGLSNKRERGNTLTDELGALDDKLAGFQKEYQTLDREYMLVLKECLGGESETSSADEEMQTKFVDWAFMKYQDKKETLKKMAEEIAAQKKAAAKGDSSQSSKAISSALTQLNYDKIDKTITEERNRLIDHIEMMQEIYKKNQWNSQILFRLAELYFDRAGDEFREKLRKYEKDMAEQKDSANLEFPDYDLTKVIFIYDSIVQLYPKSEIADDAMFYKAAALQKEGDEESANEAMKALVNKYPESEFFVEANMNIGKFYFEHPKAENNTGYKIAEEAYRKVLFYREHPQFVQALYHLGWCYYMQDKFDEAIAVFKYLVEEAKLDFDPSKMEEKQVVNPLLRGEAIDYIAISFDEEGKVDDVLKFLQLIGNDDYSALVLKRIAELRAEDLDYDAAIKMNRRLLAQFPNSTSAPDASISIIKLFEIKDKLDSAQVERQHFFELYCKGSQWNNELGKRDTSLVNKIDSVAIAIGLSIADAYYRNAEKSIGQDEYKKAADAYKMVVEKYPDVKSAGDARWNLAVILETKLFDKPTAYNEYIRFSQLSHIDSTRREQAALNAIAIAQSMVPVDSAADKGALDFSSEKVVEAVNNYLKVFPGGGSYNKVLLGMGAIYFNRQMYQRAEEIYKQIIDKGTGEKEYYEALLFMAQCYFGQEKWPPAIESFEKVWKGSDNQGHRTAAYKFLLQAEFLYAKSHFASANYDLAAQAFTAIEQKYPGSEYGDIVLYNAAEAHEKKERWNEATESYLQLVTKYPQSKLAADALFNAAGDFEKADKYARAADCYNQIINQYASSDKAKDALFNLGLCYEKLGKLDEMAETNERYSAMYPGEKDVETMLLRSAAYYAKTNSFDKAINVYRNFVRRFPNSPRAIECLFMIAKCQFDLGDKENAVLGFSQAEQQNIRFAQEGIETNNYYASEAAFMAGMIKRDKFLAIKLVLPDDVLKRLVKEKSDLLNEAAKAFQRVIQYQSEKMFEAAYRVGQLYEDMAIAYKEQERPKLDPIKTAVLEKEILNVSSQLMQKSFIPYTKAIMLAKSFDSLKVDQRIWIQKSQEGIAQNLLKAGQLLFSSVAAMNDAPIPKEIQEKPLHYYQYLKKLLETLAPLKLQVANYYGNALQQLDTLKLRDNEPARECANQFAFVNYLIGDGYDKLATLILSRTKEITKNLSENEKEDLVFQLEDIVFELQDKAIVEFEDGLGRIEEKMLAESPWYTKIIESLARLSPDKYGASFYKTDVFVSGSNWVVRADSVENWNSNDVPKDGWSGTRKNDMKLDVAGGSASGMWGDEKDTHIYMWKNVFLNGTPRNASVYVSSMNKYNLYVNGSLTLKDTLGKKDVGKTDSATGIVALLKGGDNVIAIEAKADSGQLKGICVVFNTLLDTTGHFQPSIALPSAFATMRKAEIAAAAEDLKAAKSVAGADTTKNSIKNETGKPDDYIKKYKNRGEFLKAIADFEAKERETNNQIRLEEGEVRKLRVQNADIDAALQKVNAEIEELKKKKENMSRGK
jgi:TolA-binding protein